MPRKIYMSTESADLANFNYKGVYVSLTIDTRKWAVTKRDNAGRPIEHDQFQELPIVLRVTKDSKRLYLSIAKNVLGTHGWICVNMNKIQESEQTQKEELT